MQKERTIVAIGEPRIDALPTETADFFYETLLSRISDLIQPERAEAKTLTENSESKEDNV